MSADPGGWSDESGSNIAARLRSVTPTVCSPAVVQERGTGDVLMVAWMDDDALARTLRNPRGHLLFPVPR